MKKIIFAVLCTVATLAVASNDIDWSRVKPLGEYPEFWIGKQLQPSPEYFELLRNPIDNYITSGNVAGRHDFPFKTALVAEMPFGQSLCGGALISRWAVLTAGHCIYRSTSTLVVLGGSDLTQSTQPLQVRFRVQSANYRIHQHFREGIFNSDVAIVRFHHAIHMFTSAVNIVHLPTAAQVSDQFANQNSLVMGFGRYSDTSTNNAYNLRYVGVSTMTNLLCSVRHPGLIDTSHICTSGVSGIGFCSGDEGAPLVLETTPRQYLQVGIASFYSPTGCQAGSPSVYTRITPFLGWIEQNM